MLKLKFQRIYYLLKSIGIGVVLPAAVLFVLLPFALYGLFRKYDDIALIYREFLVYSYILVPISSVWWNLLAFRDYTETDAGAEVLLFQSKKSLFSDFALPFAIYCIMLIFAFSLFNIYLDGIIIETVKLIVICLFYFSVLFYIMLVLRNFIFALMFAVMYSVINIISQSYNGGIGVFPFYFSLDGGIDIYLFSTLPLFSASAAILAFSVLKKEKSA